MRNMLTHIEKELGSLKSKNVFKPFTEKDVENTIASIMKHKDDY